MNLDASKRKTRARPELSVFEEELNVPFNPKEFLPDVPSHARAQIPSTQPRTQEVEPNLGQSEAKVEPELGTKLGQSEAKVEPNPLSSSKLSTNLSQTSASIQKKVEPQLRPQVEPILSQSEAKVEPTQPLSALVGLQRNVLLYVYSSCRAQGSKTSAPISIENLAETSRSTLSAVRKAAQRLEGKGFVTRANYKDGRGGWTQYAIPDPVYNALLLDETRAKVEPNLGQTRAKVGTEVEPQLRPSLSSSSSFIDSNQNFKTTTTGEVEFFEDGRIQLAPEWAAVDFSALADVGFSRAHLTQLVKHGKLSSLEVQDSIHFFAFDLRRNGKGRELKGPPLNFFMGILRKGLPYAPPENYESPEAEARHKYLEGKRRIEERRLAEENELKDLEFAQWRRGLTEPQAIALVPDPVKDIPRAREASLRLHFDEQVCPRLEASRFGEDAVERAQIRAEIAQSLGEVRN